MKQHHRFLPAIVMAGLVIAAPSEMTGGAPPAPLEVSRSCEVELPFDAQFSADPGQVLPGGVSTLNGTFDAKQHLDRVVLRFETEGPVRLAGPSVVDLGMVGADEVRPFSVPVEYTGDGDAIVHVYAEADPGAGDPLMTRRGSLYSVIDEGRVFTGRGGFVGLKLTAVDAAAAAGKFASTQAADDAKNAVLALPGAIGGDFIDGPPLTPMTRALNELVGAPANGRLDDLRHGGGDVTPNGGLTVSGQIRWEDENGDPHPAYGIQVFVWEDNAIFDIPLGNAITATDGTYSLPIANADLENAIPDIYVVVNGTNGWIDLQPDGGGSYSATGPTADDQAGPNIVYNLTINNGGPSAGAFSVHQAATWIAGYVAVRNGAALPQVIVYWPNGDTGSFFDGAVQIEQADRWDWDTIHHEYGHYVMDDLNFQDNPGGPHNITDCHAVVRGNKSEGLRLAWGEGWPTFMGTSAQEELGLAALNIPRVGDTQYDDQEDDGVNYDLEPQSNGGRGEDNELAVQRAFWDAYDNPNDGRDLISLSSQTMWNAMSGSGVTTMSAAWNQLLSAFGAEDRLLLGEISADHGMGPSLNSPVQGTIINTVAQANFSWNRGVGCSNTYDGDSFDLRFYSHLDGSLILSIPGIGGTSQSLNQAQLDLLRNNNHFALWGVRGYNGDSPATGPYLGETFLITLNSIPEADAGTDQTVECTGFETTPVLLDGTGSSDADNDVLIYTWSAPGIDFDDVNSHTPTGEFPIGTTTVTLKVFDGFQEDTDTVEITVEDTTPPVITCPDPVTVGCSGHCEGGGTLASDPQLNDFFSMVSATDVCDSDPVLSNNAPECFPVGDTDVTFYAEDISGNIDSCTVTVTVEDTTPPVIEVVLNRDALWPPNHKLVPITAEVTVTDICDPNPTYVLTEVTSDEPDNGLGDGDTEGDIVIHDDNNVELRAERAGGGDGRKYQFVYTAMDASGNTATDTVCVIVPHDQRGHAMASSGFVPTGQALDPSQAYFTLLILSKPNFSPRTIAGTGVSLGNDIDGFRPTKYEHRDVNGDREVDLVLTFDTRRTLELRSQSTKKDPIGLHWWGADGQGYLVPDIMKLGTPLPLAESDGVHEGDAIAEDDSGVEFDNGPESDEGLEPEFGFDSRGGLTVSESGPVTVEVFDVTGRRVRTLVSANLSAGRHELAWDGRDDAGRSVASGLYFYRARGVEGVVTRKVLVQQ
jgi:hypothetical protein